MKTNLRQEMILLLPAIIFTIGLTFASVELPKIINSVLHDAFIFPGGDPKYHPDILFSFIRSNYLHAIGYGALALLIFLTAVGIITQKKGLAAAGAAGFFIPVFGHFCKSMFFLAGLGMLRTLWFPITDVSMEILRFGDIIYLPYAVLVYIPALVGIDIREILPYIIMGSGILIFLLGVAAWFSARVRRKKTADFGIYRISRHPQYLGWIIWSYGVTVYFTRYFEGLHFKLSWGYSDSLAFLFSSLVIIGVAMIEEIKMKKQHGGEYDVYSSRAPFMVPIPIFLTKIISAPMLFVIKKSRPENGKEVAAVLAVYGGILILLSLLLVILHFPPPRGGWWAFPYNVFPFR